MSLADELAHARKMATARHKPECAVLVSTRWSWKTVHPDPKCPGCVTDADRALWRQLADEYEAHIERNREDTLL